MRGPELRQVVRYLEGRGFRVYSVCSDLLHALGGSALGLFASSLYLFVATSVIRVTVGVIGDPPSDRAFPRPRSPFPHFRGELWGCCDNTNAKFVSLPTIPTLRDGRR
jgi:hypothetical protein